MTRFINHLNTDESNESSDYWLLHKIAPSYGDYSRCKSNCKKPTQTDRNIDTPDYPDNSSPMSCDQYSWYKEDQLPNSSSQTIANIASADEKRPQTGLQWKQH